MCVSVGIYLDILMLKYEKIWMFRGIVILFLRFKVMYLVDLNFYFLGRKYMFILFFNKGIEMDYVFCIKVWVSVIYFKKYLSIVKISIGIWFLLKVILWV